MAFAALAAPVVAAGAPAADEGTDGAAWGVGWSTLPWTGYLSGPVIAYPGSSGGPTLRGRSGPWQLGIAVTPSLSGNDRVELRSEQDHDSVLSYRLPSDYDAQAGWIRLEAGRDLWRRGRLSLDLLATGSYYRGSEERAILEPIYWTDPPRERTRTEEVRQTTWGVGIGLRPRYALLERLTIDFDFGFSLLWWDREYETWSVDHGSPEWEHTLTHEDGTSFQTVGGWGGLGSLNLILWF